MSEMIRFNPAAVESALETVSSSLTSLNQGFETLNTSMAQLGSWQGAAKDSYSVVQSKWGSVAGELNQALMQIRTGIQTAGENLSNAERSITSMWQG
jgi:WXG100 family type VII secretion target